MVAGLSSLCKENLRASATRRTQRIRAFAPERAAPRRTLQLPRLVTRCPFRRISRRPHTREHGAKARFPSPAFITPRETKYPFASTAVVTATVPAASGAEGAWPTIGHLFKDDGPRLPLDSVDAVERTGWNRDAIERQLAHGERNKIRAAYNFAEFLPERRRMMQAWADYLDQLRNATTGSVAAPVEETAAV